MRLFVALDLPEAILQRLERLISSLRPEALIKWSAVHNLHVTTKFIGEWPENRLAEVDAALRAMKPRPAFPIALKGFGWFPNPRSPHVFWCGVDGGDLLRQLAQDTDESLAGLGIRKETKPFSPHLTLARINSPVPLHRLQQRVSEMALFEAGEFLPEAFYLYQSVPGPNSSQYHKLREYPFESAAAASRASL